MWADLVQATVVLVMAYLIIANGDKFATAVQAAGTAYVGAVKALQGR